MSFRICAESDEELAVDKVHQSELADGEKDDFDDLYHAVKTASVTDEPDEGLPDDTEDKDAISQVSQEDKEETDDTTGQTTQQTSQEDFSDIASAVGRGIATGASVGGTALVDSVKYLTDLGIAYGPGIAKRVLKTVTYILGKIAKSVLLGTVAIAKFAKRHIESFARYRVKVLKLKVSLAALKAHTDTPKRLYENEVYIRLLATNGKVNILRDAVNVGKMLNNIGASLLPKVKANVASTKFIIDRTIKGDVINTAKLPVDDISFPGFSKKEIHGVSDSNALLDMYAWETTLPGEMRLVGHAPKPKLAESDFIQACGKSKVGMVVIPSQIPIPESIPMLSFDDIGGYVDSLLKICDIGLSATKTFNDIIKLKQSLKGSLKSYTGWLYESSEVISLKDSMADYLAIKMAFVDATAIAGTMSAQSYTLKYIHAATQYAKDSIRAYI